MLESNIKFYIQDEKKRVVNTRTLRYNMKHKDSNEIYAGTMGEFDLECCAPLSLLRQIIKKYPPGQFGSSAEKFTIKIKIINL